jgi:hypothetical protein
MKSSEVGSLNDREDQTEHDLDQVEINPYNTSFRQNIARSKVGRNNPGNLNTLTYGVSNY